MHNNIQEIVDANEIELSSFDKKDELNPKLWYNNKLKPKVKKQLFKIANDYIEFLDIEFVNVIDIVITGSLSNYNWSEYSDIDLHIIIDYKEIDNNIDLVTNYLKSRQKLWDNVHGDLKIYGYVVSPYIQNHDEVHVASGVYSIENDEWIKEPSKNIPQINKPLIRKKASQLINNIEKIENLYKKGDYNDALISHKKLWDKIKKMRKHGLSRDGEFSFENIIFKVLRRGGYLDRMEEIKNKAYNELNTIDELKLK